MDAALHRKVGIRTTNVVFALCLPLFAAAQPVTSTAEGLEDPEEIIVTGQRYELYKAMMQAEKNAYETFNKFNDDKRFAISCSVHQPTGSHLSKQSCTPEFEIQATRGHAQDFQTDLRHFINPDPGDDTSGNFSQSGLPMEMLINKDLSAYRKKLKETAEQHPEFLEAIVNYTKVKEQYQGAGKSAGGKN